MGQEREPPEMGQPNMSSIKILTAISILPVIAACNAECAQSDTEFLQCWAKPAATGIEANPVISFEAVAVPRQGVIAGSPSCRYVRLQFQLSRNVRDQYSEIFKGDRIHKRGLRGVAMVKPMRRQSSCVLLVEVIRLSKIEVLSDTDTKRVWENLGRT